MCPDRRKKRLHTIGCAGRLTQFSETEDGRYMVTLSGISRFRVQQEVSGFTPYRRCEVSWDGFSADLAGPEEDRGFDRKPFLDLLGRYFEALSLSTDWDSLKEAEDELLINSLSIALPLRSRGENRRSWRRRRCRPGARRWSCCWNSPFTEAAPGRDDAVSNRPDVMPSPRLMPSTAACWRRWSAP